MKKTQTFTGPQRCLQTRAIFHILLLLVQLVLGCLASDSSGITSSHVSSNRCPICGKPNDSNCDEIRRCTAQCGIVKSTSYPMNYGNNHRCRWSISAPNTYYVNLTVLDFDIPSANKTDLGNCIYDYLTVIDGYSGKRLGLYCNENLPPMHIISPWNELVIQFDTNSETTGRGFYIEYRFMKLELSPSIRQLLKPPPPVDNNQAGVDIGCAEGWQYFRRSCYRAYSETEPLQWYDAENKCNSHGKGLDGHLVSVLDRDEMQVLLYLMTNVWQSPKYTDYYIGLIDVSREGLYRWSDNNPMSYTDWELRPMLLEDENPAQPDGGAYEDCTIIRFNAYSRTSNWHDVPCSLGRHYHSHLANKSDIHLANAKKDYVNSYICKADSISISSKRRPLFSNEFVPYLEQSEDRIQHLLPPASRKGKELAVLKEVNQFGIDANRLTLSMLDDNRYFVCNNSEVISVVLRCDGVPHCRDGSDESINCDQHCLDWQFKCANMRCISIGSYCNFVDDCGDGSDESRCERHRCKLNEFKCQNGQCIMAQQRCDLLPDCSDLSDEGKLCTIGSSCNSASTFQCYNGNCIPQYAVCDFQIDCPGKFHEDEDSATCDVLLKERSLITHKSYESPSVMLANLVSNNGTSSAMVTTTTQMKDIERNLFRCASGNIISKELRCLYEFDRYGYQIGCRDVTHLTDCADFECPRHYVKCANSYCIPWHYICDGKWDCIMGEDEVGCVRYVCPGQYKCANQSSCILLHQLCDGQRHCPMGDDEWFCDLQCPPQCDCIGHSVNCRGANLSSLPSNYISKSVRKLDLSHNRLGSNLSNSDFTAYHDLGELILSHNGIEVLSPRKFHQLRNLYKLDLSYNQIHSVKRGAFAGLRRVTQLLLESNPELVILEPEAFLGLSSLQILNISSSRIHALRKNTFDGLISLRQLLLRNNMIVEIEDGAFKTLNSLVSLDMRGNRIRTFTKSIFTDLKSLRNLSTDSFKFCCLVNQQVPADKCLPLPDEISDCEDLLSSVSQYTCICLAGIIAFVGNLIVIVWRYKDLIDTKADQLDISRRERAKVNSTLLLSLGCADFLMGIYLLLIAIVDSWYRGRYIENWDNWRESNLCNMCGFLSTVSIEVSMFTLVLIAYNRCTEVCEEFDSRYKLTRTCYTRLVLCSWIFALVIATLPLVIKPYFKDQFYARSGVCLAFHITSQKAAGWHYSVVVFQGFYLVAFLIIVTCYRLMYIKLSQEAHKFNGSKQPKQPHQVKIVLILIASFIALAPTIILSLMSLAGIALPAAVYSWVAVLVLPVNSAINPIIYTIPSIRHHIRLLLSNYRARQSANAIVREQIKNGHTRIKKNSLPLLNVKYVRGSTRPDRVKEDTH